MSRVMVVAGGLALGAGFAYTILKRADRSRKVESMEEKHLQLGYHLVAFLDVLGQRERFKALHLPKTPEQAAIVAEVLRQTAGFVMELRQGFAEHFTIFESTLTHLRQHTSETVRPKFVGFSDSFVTSVPLRSGTNDLVPIISIFSSLSAAATVMLTSLASKHPLRGGIDVGLATEISPGEIYGTALANAYLLECEVAKYPRIVLGDDLMDYLTVASANFEAQTSPQGKLIAAIIAEIMKLTSTDFDGKKILDYLGPAIFAHSKPGAEREAPVRSIYEFVLAEQKRISSGNNPELKARYQAFRRYVESRLPLWGLKIEKDELSCS